MNIDHMNIRGYLIVQEAWKRGYEIEMISEKFSLFYLILGEKKILFKNEDCGLRSWLSYKLCKSKSMTNIILEHWGIQIPTYKHFTKGSSIDIDDMEFPLVVKPNDRSCNKGVTISITNAEDMTKAIDIAYQYSDDIIVQKHVSGDVYRVFVLDHKIVALTKLVPPYITWDGVSTIQQLIEQENMSPRRQWWLLDPAYPIKITDEVTAHIASLWYDIWSIIAKDEKLSLSKNPQLSFWGITENMPVEFINISLAKDCLKAAELLELPWGGIDVLSPDIAWWEYAIIEVNGLPDFKMHHYPFHGEGISIASSLFDFILKHK